MKKIFMWTILVLVMALFVDFAASWMLFHYYQLRGYDEPRFTYHDGRFPSEVILSKIWRKVIPEKIKAELISGKPYCPRSIPSPLFRRNDYLGWYISYGKYEVYFCNNKRNSNIQYRWNITMDADNSRSTSHTNIETNNEIYIFGDSFIFGWGINDENTFPWHLQDYFREKWKIYNFSNGGYGNQHNLLQYRKIKDKIDNGDIVILTYAQYMPERNVASPSFFSLLAGLSIHVNDQQNALPQYPKAQLIDGQVQFEYIPLDCAEASGYCENQEPTDRDKFAVTAAIFDEIIEDADAKLFILFTLGDDDDPIIEHLQNRGIEIIDVRKDTYAYFTDDDIWGYDSHPGVITNYVWYETIRDRLEQLVEPTGQLEQ